MEFWADTNILLRFLANDHPEHSEMARDIMRKVKNGKIILHINPMVIAECCFVLEGKHYAYDKKLISSKLKLLLISKGIKSREKSILLYALDKYECENVDFEDAYIAAYAKANLPKEILSFNIKDFRKIDAECYTPRDVLDSLGE
jgi:predicted nucleic acid-binding protein